MRKTHILKLGFIILLFFIITLCLNLNKSLASTVEKNNKSNYDLHLTFKVKFGYKTWQEYLLGTQILKESGLLSGIEINLEQISYDTLVFNFCFEGYIAALNYEGNTTDFSTPVNTVTGYLGISEELTMGILFPFSENFIIKPYGGFAFDFWDRKIVSTSEVLGYTEQWFTLFLPIGGEIILKADRSKMILGGWKGIHLITINRPVVADDYLELKNANFYKVYLETRIHTKNDIGFGISYRYRHWDRSESKYMKVFNSFAYVFQPESKEECTLIYFSIYF